MTHETHAPRAAGRTRGPAVSAGDPILAAKITASGVPEWAAEIASAMHLSVNTVKTHIKNILRKLAASHRREAVCRGRQLGLI